MKKNNKKSQKRKFYAVYYVNENTGCIYLDYNLCKKSIKDRICVYRYFYRLYDALKFLDEQKYLSNKGDNHVLQSYK